MVGDIGTDSSPSDINCEFSLCHINIILKNSDSKIIDFQDMIY